MKNFAFTIAIMIVSHGFAIGSTKRSSQLRVCQFLESMLMFQVFEEKKKLPSSWDTFDVINLMRKKPLHSQLHQMKTINSFVIVPGAPVIQDQPGISREYKGQRLFLISREENVTRFTGNGRCAIFIKVDGVDSNPVRTSSRFIPEAEAQMLLKQLKNLDLSQQPLAFENVDELEIEVKELKQRLQKLTSDHINQIQSDSIQGEWYEFKNHSWLI